MGCRLEVEEVLEEVLEVEEEVEEVKDMTGMTINEYGRGYMVYAKETDSRYGDPYLMTGFWVIKQKGWFFKGISGVF